MLSSLLLICTGQFAFYCSSTLSYVPADAGSWRGSITEEEDTTLALAADKLAVLIPADNEGSVIGPTLARVRSYIATDDIFVIVDNCMDDIAPIARQRGAQVWERHQSDETGIGAALRWFLHAAAQELRAYDAIAIFDADSVMDESSFWHHAETAMAQGAEVVQVSSSL